MNSLSFAGLLKNRSFLFLFVFIVSSIVMFHRLAESPLGGDDCYYAEVSKEMARSGDYVSTMNAYRPDFSTSKPPMLFWMNALSGKIFTFNTFAMRLPSALLGFLCVMVFMVFIARYFDVNTAFIAALTLTFTQQYMYHARSSVTDGPFAVFFAFSLMSFWVARSEKLNIFYYVTGFFLGLAVMTRQLPGFFILPVIFAYIILSREYGILKNIHFYGGLALSAVVFMPWHILVYLKYKELFLSQYFKVSFMTAFSGYPEGYSSSPSLNPWYAYLQILANNYWPWLPFFVYGVYYHIKSLGLYDKDYKNKILFFLLWGGAPLLIFQAAKVKQYHYIVPLYIPFALITATVFMNFREAVRQKAVKILVLLVSCLTVSYIVFPIVPKTLDSREFVDTIKLIPEIKKAEGNINILPHGSSHYHNCLLFYADKDTDLRSMDEMLEMINSGQKAVYVAFKEDFRELSSRVTTGRITIIQATDNSVLFSS